MDAATALRQLSRAERLHRQPIARDIRRRRSQRRAL